MISAAVWINSENDERLRLCRRERLVYVGISVENIIPVRTCIYAIKLSMEKNAGCAYY